METRKPLAGNLAALAGWFRRTQTAGTTSCGLDNEWRPDPRARPGLRPPATAQHLLVAQDQSRLEATRALINQASLWALGGGLLLALVGGLLMSYSVMGRIDAINRASREIMTGRLQSRMPVRGVNDEFDQLSENLNAMLDRIDSLIEGVKSVADNIAHDLRTPLTRLRGRLENLTARPDLARGCPRRTGLGHD